MTTRSGYSIRITGFVPTDPKDLAGHRAILDAIDLATKNPEGEEMSTTDALFRLMEVEDFDVRPVTRRAKDAGLEAIDSAMRGEAS